MKICEELVRSKTKLPRQVLKDTNTLKINLHNQTKP